MANKSYLITIIAVLVSFAVGFLLANALNRDELDAVRLENNRLKTSEANNTQNTTELTLTNDEIQTKIADADANPGNFTFQKNLGLALYRYGSMKKDSALISRPSSVFAGPASVSGRAILSSLN